MFLIKKIFGFSVNRKISAISLLIIFIVGIGLLLALTRYTIPFYDDFGYGKYAKANMSEPWDIPGAVKGAADGTHTMWYAWQGTYTSIFMMNMMPGIYGENLYFLGPVFLILIFVASIFTLVHVIAKDVFDANRWDILSLQCLTAGLAVLYVHSAHQGFYWYNSGVHYTAMHSFLILLTACLIRILTSKSTYEKSVLMVATILLGVVIGGANYVTALQCGLVMASLVAIAIILKRKSVLFFIPSIAAYGISFYYSIIAPGNNVRAACFWYVEKSVPKAIIGSFTEAVKLCKEFSNWKTMLVLILIIPVAWRIVKETQYVFRWWVMVLLMIWSVCFVASGFTSSLYSTGEVVLARVINVIKFDYHLVLVANEVYVIGFAYQLIRKKSKNAEKNILLKWKSGVAWPLIILWVGAYFFFYTNEVDPIGSYSVFGAHYYLTTGQAEEFYEQYKERVEILNNDSITDVVFEPYTVRPWFLINMDISTDAGAEPNVALAQYYGKNSVRISD